MKAKLITNPYIVYSIGFLLVLITYSFHWSDLYPFLSPELFLFILATVIFSIVIGLLFHKTNYLSYKNVDYSTKRLWLVTIFIVLGYFVECAYMRVIPVIAILNHSDYNYTTFGIPTFHVVLVTFNSFWAVFVFHNYISKKKKNLLFCFILCLFPAILIFNRAMLLLNLASSFFVLFMSAKHIKKLLFKVSLFLVALLFLFGLAGNIRVTQGTSVNDVILSLGGATKEFKESSIPKEFFWSYLYISSPIANVQKTINEHHITPFSLQKFGTFINRTFLPDFISKRIFFLQEPIEHVDQISASFTVGSVYGTSSAYFKWWGMLIMYVFILLFNLVIIFCLNKRSMFFVTGIAILDCIMLFSIFDNMFSFSGLSMQLFYPVIFGLLSRINFSAKPQRVIVAEN